MLVSSCTSFYQPLFLSLLLVWYALVSNILVGSLFVPLMLAAVLMPLFPPRMPIPDSFFTASMPVLAEHVVRKSLSTLLPAHVL